MEYSKTERKLFLCFESYHNVTSFIISLIVILYLVLHSLVEKKQSQFYAFGNCYVEPARVGLYNDRIQK